MSEVSEDLKVFKGEKIAVKSLQDLPDRCIVETKQGLALLEREEVGFRFWLSWLPPFHREGTALEAANGRVHLKKGLDTYSGEVFATRGGVVVHDEPGAIYRGPNSVSNDYEGTLTDALHELADNNDWCSEFDNLMDTVGLPSRVRNLVSTISAEISVDIDGIGADEVYQALVNSELPGVSITNVNVRGDVQVEYHWEGLPGDSCPADESDVSGLVDELLPDHYVDVLDWAVEETRIDD